MKKAKELSLDRLIELVEDNLPDPRRPGGNIRHKLVDLLVIVLLGVICGCETWIDIEDYVRAKYEWLKGFLELPGGIPSNDTYRRLMERIRTEKLEEIYRQWVLPYVGGCIGKHVAIDGKTICAASNNRQSHEETDEGKLHIISAWVREDGISLGQVKTDEKSNEITAIPKMLETLDIKGATVTIDAIGTHESIAKAVRNTGAEYILPVKENQSTMLDDIRFYAENEIFTVRHSVLAEENRYAVQNDKGHGRIEKRECYLFDSADWLKEQYHWTDLHGVAVIRSTRTMINTGETSTYDRYFIYSHTEMTAERFLKLQRKHWTIENNLHWCLDCCFHEDDMHVRLGHAAVVINSLRKPCMQMLKSDTTVKDSLAGKPQRCAWPSDNALSLP